MSTHSDYLSVKYKHRGIKKSDRNDIVFFCFKVDKTSYLFRKTRTN